MKHVILRNPFRGFLITFNYSAIILTNQTLLSSLHPMDNNLYFVSKDPIDKLQPSLRDDVISLYGLKDIADALARTKPDGSKGVKLRKSYKSHIQDLPGRHSIPTPNAISNFSLEDQSKTDRNLSMLASVPLQSQNDFVNAHPPIETLNLEFLTKAMNFEITGPNGVPGFDASKLAMDDSTTDSLKLKSKKRKAEEDLLNAKKKITIKM